MKKIWSYIAMFFIGLSSGIVFAVKYLNEKTVYKGNFKLKQRGQGNTQNSDLTIDTAKKAAKDQRKLDRLKAKNDKRADKLRKKIEKKAEKSAARLEKTP